MVIVGPQAWACDAAGGFAPVIAVQQNVSDPILAIGTSGGVKLPISSTTVPATCGQSVLQFGNFVYVTQAIVDAKNTPSTARGVLRTELDPSTGALVGPTAYIATTAGLDGNQPTAAAIGPDGNLYVAFLKSGNVKRILNPSVGTTQVVQSVGNTPSGHPARALAFVGGSLWIGSVDSLSVIQNATSLSCTGGCNATTISDGFSAVAHTGMAYDGVDGLYFAVAGSPSLPGSSQAWRLSMSTGLYTFVAQGGADRNGANASNFSFVAGKTNLLTLDASGNLWIGDDTSNATAVGAGRLWTVSAASLATLTGGGSIAGTNLETIFGVLRGPWTMAFVNGQQFTPTFNADGTFTSPTGPGTWILTPPNRVQQFGNPQGHLTFTDSQGGVLFSADFLMLRLDQLVAVQPWTGSLGTPISGVLSKQTP